MGFVARVSALGGVLRSLLAAARRCCCGCPDAIPEGTKSIVYRIAGYTDGDITACAGCPDDAGTAWDGRFTWDAGSSRWVDSGQDAISGKQFDAAWLAHSTTPPPYAAPHCWEVVVACGDGETMVRAEKLGGQSPAGVYARTSGGPDDGCDLTATWTIEEVP